MSLHQAPFLLDALTPAVGHQPPAVTNVMDEVTALVARRPGLTLDDPHDQKYAPAVTSTVEGQTTQDDGDGA